MRTAIIALLSEAPSNGYQIIQEIKRVPAVSGGEFGLRLPHDLQLEDEGLIEPPGNGRKVLALTARAASTPTRSRASGPDLGGGRGRGPARRVPVPGAGRAVDRGRPAGRRGRYARAARGGQEGAHSRRQSLYLLLAADADEVTAPSAGSC
ncbi:hypothetical protein GXW82_00300 [Streptacidiphilus sp. 4-A2]|nr:hypothetical protein [Streptacidiphilus sp. 4-A2]